MKVSVVLSLYKTEKYLSKYLENVAKQSVLDEIELSIVHNEPSEAEKQIIDSYRDKINMVYTEVPLEPLYRSWNRAMLQANGEYLVCWNVDDLRTGDSIEKMVKTLDEHPEIGFTYGDFMIVGSFGATEGRRVQTKEFSLSYGTTGSIGGPFFMWRRALTGTVGYFDEQFKSGGDFDYTVRLAVMSKGKKTEGILGYFLNEQQGLSTKHKELQVLERTVIEMRYGIWYKMDIDYITKALSYRVNALLQPVDTWVTLPQSVATLAQKRRYWILLIGYGMVKNSIIRLLVNIKSRLVK